MEHYSNVVKAMIARSKARAADIADKIQARAYYQFQYVPPAGPLPGYAMEQQTEDAINEIGNIAYSSDEIAREAREIAQQAYNAAQAAIEMATNAITAAQNAQQTADTALNTANTAVSKADNAQASADAAQKAADAAQKSANDAQTSANNAQSTADTAIKNASQALSAANEAKSSADQSNQRLDVLEPIVDTLRWYENITDNIDFNTHVELERAFLQGTANTNGPVAGPGWLDVDDYNETYIRQKFIAQANGACYVRFGTIVPDSSPIEVSSWTGWVKYALASELTSAVETINNSITSINGEITTIKGDITSIEGDITELQGSLGSAEGNITTVKNALDEHKADYDNPHKVTAAQLGLATVYKYNGSVETYADLPTSGQKVGDVYNVKQADPNHKIKAGDNVAWDGTTWDILAGDTDLSGYAQLNSANTFTAMNVFRTNIAVSNGTAAGSQGQIVLGVKPRTATVQANIISSTTGALNYNATETTGHYFKIGNNIATTSITSNESETAIFSHNAFEFARITNVGVAKWFGNANTATKLETARTINGVPFDGTQNITIEAGQGEFLPLTGGTVTGPIYLPSTAPTTDTQAVTKKYVDDSVAGAGGGDVTAAGDNYFTGKNTFNRPITVRDGELAGIGGTITLGTKPNSATTQAKINSTTTGAMYYTATEGLAHFFNVGTAAVATIGGTATTATLDFLANSILKYSTSSGLRVGGGGTSKIMGFYPEAADNTAGMRLSNQAEAISTDYSIFSLQNNSAINYANNAALQVGSFKFLEIDKTTQNLTLSVNGVKNGTANILFESSGDRLAQIDYNGTLSLKENLIVGSTANTNLQNGVIRAGNSENCLYFCGTAENTYYSTPKTGNTISYQPAANIYLINAAINNATSLTMDFSGMNFKATVGSTPYMCKTLTFWVSTGATAPTVTWKFPSGATVNYPKGVAPALTGNANNIINVVAIVDDTDSFSIQVCDVVALPYSG